jgi:uncharacterized membrane protein
METFKKHWITSMGMLFLFLGFLYFLKMAIDQNWVPPVVRAVAGIAAGTSCMFIGFLFFKKEKITTAELLAGFGISLIFATFAYTSFSSNIHWSTNSLFICVLALTGLFTWVGYRYNLRILLCISLLGGLLAPVILKAGPEQIFALFLYLTVLNIAALFISVSKGWNEIRVMSFAITVMNYITYYVLFDPASWGKPFFYISCIFVVYMIGTIVALFRQKDNFAGLNLYLSIINAINYVFWSIFIFNQFDISYNWATILSGFIFVLTGAFIYFYSRKCIVAPAIIYFGLGILLLAISGGEMRYFSPNGINYVMSAGIWLMLAAIMFIAGIVSKKDELKYISTAGWLLLLIYWACVAWEVKWVPWFGVTYIPFINPGALIWMALAFLGFVFAAFFNQRNHGLSIGLGILSHIVVGGLLTVQITNVWQAYSVDFSVQLALSVSWMIYALVLFLWGAYNRDTIFRVFGSVVMIFTAVKVLLFDLSGNATIYKVLCLITIGVIVLGISYINQRWNLKETSIEEISETNNA